MKGTPYRWLDIDKLVRLLCHEQNPNCEIVAIKYFTAPIKAKLSSHGEASCKAQQDYLLSIKAHNPDLTIIMGKYNIQAKEYYAHLEPVDFDKKHAVWMAEEKQTDVSIAVHLLSDVFDNGCDQAILFTNDSDLAPAIEAVKARNTRLIVGVVAPIRGEGRQPSEDLRKHSDWTRNGIKESELESTQLPGRVTTRKRTISKPEHW